MIKVYGTCLCKDCLSPEQLCQAHGSPCIRLEDGAIDQIFMDKLSGKAACSLPDRLQNSGMSATPHF